MSLKPCVTELKKICSVEIVETDGKNRSLALNMLRKRPRLLSQIILLRMKSSFWVGLLTICALTAKGAVTGQLWYGVGLGQTADNVTGHINSDGSSPTMPLRGGGFLRIDVAVDPAAGFYWVIDPTTGSTFGTPSSDPTALNLIEYRISDNAQVATLKIGDSADQDEVNSMAIDPINHILYVAEWGVDQAHSGISKVSYNPTTGAMTGGFGSATFLVNNANFSGLDLVRYMSLDLANHKLYFVDNDNGYSLAPYSPNNGVYVVDTATVNPVPTRLSSIDNVVGGFPPGPGVGQGGGTAATDDPNGLIAAVAVNSANQLVYFTTQQFGEFGTNTIQNALWWINTTGANQVATKVSFPAGVVLNFPGEGCGVSFDPVARQLYISDMNQVAGAKSRILTCQLSVDGKSITSVQTNSMVTLTGNASPDLNSVPLGTTFLSLPIPAIATSASFTEGTPATLSSSMIVNSPTDGYLKGATVSIASGFTAGDVLSATAAGSISVSYNSGTGLLTLANYDTVANYQQVLRSVKFNIPGSNPDNYGSAGTSRTLTWILNDGLPNIPAGSVNTTNSALTIIAVNNPPTNHVPGTQTTAQNVNLSITGLSVTDVDANPASQNLTTTLAVTNGTLTVLTSVSGGVTSGQVTGNGTATVVMTAPQNAINATLAAANGLVYKSSASISGNDILTVTTSDNGHTGTGGALQDQDTVAITVQSPAAFTSANSTNFIVGTLGTFHLSASGSPAPTLTETNTDILPSGVLFNSGTANLSGTPAAGTGGTYTLHFFAHNGVGSDATQVFTLTVLSAPSVSCPGNILTNAAEGVCTPPISFAATATGFPTPVVSYKWNGGIITSPFVFPVGTNTVTSTATNSVGTNTCNFTVTVLAGPAPQLQIVSSGTNTLISWPTNYPCYTLQFVANLPANNWSNYVGAIGTNAGNCVVTNNPAIPTRFFRLSN